MNKTNVLWYCRVFTAVITLYLALSILENNLLHTVIKFFLFLLLSLFVGVDKSAFDKVRIKTLFYWLVPFLLLSATLSFIFSPTEMSLALSPLVIARICILTPFFEELFFRNAIMSSGKTVFNCILSGLIFALFHQPSLFFFAFLLGGYLAFSYKRTNNFLVPLVLHMSNNTLALIIYTIIENRG